MRKVLTLCAAALLLAAAYAPQEQQEQVETQEQEAVTTYTMEQFMETISISGGSFSPDESKLLVSSNESGIYNAYVVDVATGERTAVTESTTDSIYAQAYFPHDERILYTSDDGGNENYHLFVLEPDGSVTDLTQGENTREMFAGFSHDLRSFGTLNNMRNPRFFDLYEWDIETLEPILVYENNTGLDPAAFSPDRRWLALSRTNTTNDSDLLILDLEGGGEPMLISEHEGEATFFAMDFSIDSRYLYYTSNLEGEFASLWRYDVTTGEHEGVYSADWDVSFAYFSHDGTYRVVGVNEDGYTSITITNTASGEEVELPELPPGQIGGVSFSRSEELMRFYVSSDNSPRNLFIYDVAANEVRQLTDTLNPEIDANDLVASEVVRFVARDGMEIPGPLYRPIGASAENPVPALLWIHGGPGGQSRPFYSAERQFLINHGYAVFAVNNRGSSGYGKTFLAADDQRHGREPLWDCVDAKDYLRTIDWIDPDKIGILGGSYGGYMVLAALAFEPEEFDVGVDIFGVANWVRTLQSIPPYWESFREALYREIGNPETDMEMLRATSPVFHADRIARPIIILQGANDPRVLQVESDDMVAAIEANGGIVEYVVFDDEGHGFSKSANRIEGFEAVLEFLDRYLKGEGE